MNVSAWSIRNPVAGVVLFILLSFAGVLSFKGMKVQNFPDLELPTIVVTATLPGASPSQMETEVARKIEDKLASLGKLDHITTTITDGSVAISVTFEIDKNVEALTRIADRHYLIERGRVVWSGTSKELAAAPQVQHQYLGI